MLVHFLFLSRTELNFKDVYEDRIVIMCMHS